MKARSPLVHFVCSSEGTRTRCGALAVDGNGVPLVYGDRKLWERWPLRSLGTRRCGKCEMHLLHDDQRAAQATHDAAAAAAAQQAVKRLEREQRKARGAK